MTTLQSAFPVNDANLGSAGAYPAEPGMTLRDYFAAKALQGLLADSDRNLLVREAASIAYFAADAMLAERDK